MKRTRGKKTGVIKKRTPQQVAWTAFVEVPLTPEEINRYPPPLKPPEKVYENSLYSVSQFTESEKGRTIIRLGIRNKDHSARHDWREFQRIKNELLGPEAEAIELYPAENRLMDTKNDFHLWCAPGREFRVGWDGREVSEASQIQRPWPQDQKPNDLVPLDARAWLTKSVSEFITLCYWRANVKEIHDSMNASQLAHLTELHRWIEDILLTGESH